MPCTPSCRSCLLGLWLLVWVLLAVTGGEKRQLIQVDEFGNITIQKV